MGVGLPGGSLPDNLKTQRGDDNKYDGNKVMWDLLQWRALEQIAKVLTFGAQRYGAYSWKDVKEARPRYYAALLRHITAWFKGEEIDPDSGLHHLAHAGCNLLFLLEGYLEELPEFRQEEK